MVHSIKNWLLLIFMVALAATALIEFITLGLARRTFVFYTGNNGAVVVEQRMLVSAASDETLFFGKNPVSEKNRVSVYREVDITRYVEEALLGPVSPDALPLFPRETRLLSLLYRDGLVYVDLSEDAALPPPESASVQDGEVLGNFMTLHSGIKRNFPYVREIRFFIAGKVAYPDQFREGEGVALKNEI